MNRLLSEIFPYVEPEIYSFFYFRRTKNKEVELLPNCHALYYPLAFQEETKKITKGKLNFFNSKFYDHFSDAKIIKESQFKYINQPSQRASKAIILNLLDDCFGHTIMKILNLVYAYEKYGKEFDLVCICPQPLVYLIPKDKFTIISVNIHFYDLATCYDLKPIINQIKTKYLQLEYFMFNMYAVHDKAKVRSFFNFFDAKEQISKKKYFTFYYRASVYRSWNGYKQAKTVIKAFEQLKTFFSNDIKFLVVGDKDSNKFPNWIIDERVSSYSKELDLKYNKLFFDSVIVVGYFGSGLYLPSILSDFTVHLVSRDKLKLAMQDSINYKTTSILGFYENPNFFGNAFCENITPDKLSDSIISLYKAYLQMVYRMSYSDENGSNSPLLFSQEEYINKFFPFFNYQHAIVYEDRVVKKVNADMFFTYKLNKLKNIFKFWK